MILKELKPLAQIFIETAVKNLERDGHLIPICVAIDNKEISNVIEVPQMGDIKLKEQTCKELKRIFQEKQINSYFIFCEAWYKEINDNDSPRLVKNLLGGNIRVSECIDKQESIALSAVGSDGNKAIMIARIYRDNNDKPLVSMPQWVEEGPSLSGRFAELLEDSD